MRLLLLGPNGQVGWELQRSLAPLGELTALARVGDGPNCGDLTHIGQLTKTVEAMRPDVIVNAAAYTAVDRAESEPGAARAVNADAPAALAQTAKRLGALLVHYSTDYVFDGSGHAPWHEDDSTAPLNVYGETKQAGEHGIREAGVDHLIFRTSWVYAARGRNFIRTMLRVAQERDSLQVIDDQVGAPTGAELIADTTAHAIRAWGRNPGLRGTYHLVAGGETTWHGYARFVIDWARSHNWPITVADEAIEPVGREAFPTPARRPHNSRLAVRKLERAFSLSMPNWRVGVCRALAEIATQGEKTK